MPNESPRSIDVWPLRIRRERRESVVVVWLAGRIGSASVPALSAELDGIIEQGDRSLVIDLEEVDYVSSAGLLALDAARTRLAASDGRLALRGMGEAVRIAFELAGLASRFPIEASERTEQ